MSKAKQIIEQFKNEAKVTEVPVKLDVSVLRRTFEKIANQSFQGDVELDIVRGQIVAEIEFKNKKKENGEGDSVYTDKDFKIPSNTELKVRSIKKTDSYVFEVLLELPGIIEPFPIKTVLRYY